MKKVILLLSAVVALSSTTYAQYRCGSDEVNNKVREMYPDIVAANEAKLKQDIDRQLMKMDLRQFAKTTDGSDSNVILHVPIVFHIVHDYGTELNYLSDDDIYTSLEDINQVYRKANSDTADVIATFAGDIPGTISRYIGNARIQFELAQKDPNGNPTKGITHRRSYLSNAGGDQAKGDQWPPQSYMNIWLIKAFDDNHQSAAAYAYMPGSVNGTNYVYYDGVICIADYTGRDHTLPHELGHTLNLFHPWGNTNDPNVACGDDGVDDTPPTKGHEPATYGYAVGQSCGPDRLYDTNCSSGYQKYYDSATAYTMFEFASPLIDSAVLINYPDTNNSQNIMDYTYCSKMFTHLQTERMRASLQSTVANRSNLFSSTNMVTTGIADANGNILPLADLPPIPDFSTKGGTEENVFICTDNSVTFTDRSWNDTITGISWKFTDGAGTVTTDNSAWKGSVSPSFSNHGWVNVEIAATSNAGTTTLVRDSAIYIGNNTGVSPAGYFEEFNTTGGDLDEYPIFNFYDNDNKWEVVNNVGYYDNTSIRMKAYDSRTFPATMYNTPIGDYDDFYTPAFDLSSYQGKTYCNISMMASSASRVANSLYQNDKLEISYMSDCYQWTTLATLTKSDLHNAGLSATEFTPSDASDWQALSFFIPVEDRGSKVYFRFRYTCGGEISSSYGYLATGNDLFIDRIYFNDSPTGVDDVAYNKNGFAVVPNPTRGSSTVAIKAVGNNKPIQINVTDITGKVVYSTQVTAMSDTKVEIPAQYISVKGIYMVNMISDDAKQTEKLVVY